MGSNLKQVGQLIRSTEPLSYPVTYVTLLTTSRGNVSKSVNTARKQGTITTIAIHFRTIRRRKKTVNPEVGPSLGLIIRRNQLIIRKSLTAKTIGLILKVKKKRTAVLILLLVRTARLILTTED